MSTRKIITIDQDICNGCGECVPNCPEGALRIIDGKARLVSDLFCDGLGACIGHCPEGAITIEEREAEPYDEKKVMDNIIPQGANTIVAHLKHLKDHGAMEYHRDALDYLREKGVPVPREAAPAVHSHSCPGSAVRNVGSPTAESPEPPSSGGNRPSRLGNWPVQLMLVPVGAPFFKGADLVIAADCVPFAFADFHNRFLRGKALVMGCPKLDDAGFYREKLTSIFRENDIRSVTVLHMEVPCCFGLVRIVREAIAESGNAIPLAEVEIGIGGEIKQSMTVAVQAAQV